MQTQLDMLGQQMGWNLYVDIISKEMVYVAMCATHLIYTVAYDVGNYQSEHMQTYG